MPRRCNNNSCQLTIGCTLFELCQSIVVEELLVYYLHSLLHLKSDIDAFSSLDNCAAWPFENNIRKLKRKVKGRNNSAAQLVKRVLEYAILDQE